MKLSVVKSTKLKDKIPVDVDHGYRVAHYATSISERLGFDSKLISNIKCAAINHDTGKQYLSKKILYKAGRLTEAEFEHIKYHAIYSAMDAIEQRMDKDTILSIYHHHEDFSGTGYPSGIKGDEIPIGARIIRIADFFDALTTVRNYRVIKKYSFSDALQIMNDSKRKLDPIIFDAFCKAVCSPRFIIENSSCRNAIIELSSSTGN